MRKIEFRIPDSGYMYVSSKNPEEALKMLEKEGYTLYAITPAGNYVGIK